MTTKMPTLGREIFYSQLNYYDPRGAWRVYGDYDTNEEALKVAKDYLKTDWYITRIRQEVVARSKN